MDLVSNIKPLSSLRVMPGESGEVLSLGRGGDVSRDEAQSWAGEMLAMCRKGCSVAPPPFLAVVLR